MLDDDNMNLRKTNDRNNVKKKSKKKLGVIAGVWIAGVIFTACISIFMTKSNNINLEASADVKDNFEVNAEADLVEEKKEKNIESSEIQEKPNAISKRDLNLEKAEKTNLDINKTNDIKAIVEQNFSTINGGYSFAFKQLNKDYVISINNEKSVSASVIKIFVMIETFNQIQNNKLSMQESLVLKGSDKVGGAGVVQGYQSGKQLTIEELIKLMMSKSDNTATNMLIDKVGINDVNNKIKQLGCINTELNRKMMDTAASSRGIENYTSVDDLVLTLTKLYNGQCISPTYDKIMLDIMKQNENTTKICGKLGSNIEVAHKTGELAGVQNDAGIVFAGDNAYIVCFMTKKGSEQAQIGAIAKASKEIYDVLIHN